MKKLIFGCALMISGMIGATGWLIAAVSLVEPGAWSGLSNVFGRGDGIIVILFLLMAVAGLIIAAGTLKAKEDK